jgi:phosphoribosylamine--glycine ligase
MGAYSGVPEVDDALVDRLMDEAVEPLVGALRAAGIDYRGVLYAGVMLTADGPKVLEYNVRFGDPETQVVLPRLADDPVALLHSVAEGRLAPSAPAFGSDMSVCVVMAAGGYPASPRTGEPIAGLAPDGRLQEPVVGTTVFHAGTALDESGRFRTAGGRVLGMSALAPTLAGARERAYRAVGAVHWPGVQFRHDIAERAAASLGAQSGVSR